VWHLIAVVRTVRGVAVIATSIIRISIGSGSMSRNAKRFLAIGAEEKVADGIQFILREKVCVMDATSDGIIENMVSV
jgi:hypothetical protein